jgi:hypothetical protein
MAAVDHEVPYGIATTNLHDVSVAVDGDIEPRRDRDAARKHEIGAIDAELYETARGNRSPQGHVGADRKRGRRGCERRVEHRKTSEREHDSNRGPGPDRACAPRPRVVPGGRANEVDRLTKSRRGEIRLATYGVGERDRPQNRFSGEFGAATEDRASELGPYPAGRTGEGARLGANASTTLKVIPAPP